jgi:hypothetical protein
VLSNSNSLQRCCIDFPFFFCHFIQTWESMDLRVMCSFQRPYTTNDSLQSDPLSLISFTVTYPNAAAPESNPNPRATERRRPAPPHRTTPVPGDGTMQQQPFSRHAGFFASLQRVGPEPFFPSSSLPTSDAASALPLLSRWKTGWPRSNIRSRRRARRRGRQRQRQRRANPSRRRSRTP